MTVVFPDHTHLLFDVTTLMFVLHAYRKSFQVLKFHVLSGFALDSYILEFSCWSAACDCSIS